ncbi:acyltransferase family protein [Rhodococcus sp. NPDC078407]|uniref:acyltransferase family protein n=1 Tax=Rhodococcus sp. NPDC078407 TaxID=3364509 RepID=UPI0037C7992D
MSYEISVGRSPDGSDTPSAERHSSKRVEWVDVAKGVCIALVVVLHTVNFMVTRQQAETWWFGVNAVLEPVRMPLFFLVAGLFAAKDLDLSWKCLWRKRIATLLYLYVLWMLLRFALFSWFPQISGTNEASSAVNLLTGLFDPASGLWFLYALVVYVCVARLTRRVDPRLQVLFAGITSVAGPSLVADVSWTWVKIVSFLIFFLIGMHFRALALGVAKATSTWSAVLWPVGFVSMYYLAPLSPWPARSSVVETAISVVGVVTGIVVCARSQRWRLSVPLRRLGSLSLPVYLLHEIVLGTIVTAGMASGMELKQFWVAPLLVTAVVLALSVVIGSSVQNRTCLFRLPRPWRAPRALV